MLWMSLAIAAPPEGVDPDALEVWEKASGSALDGPEGCWELGGKVLLTEQFETSLTGFRRASSTPRTTTGTFEGRIEERRWTRFVVHLDAPDERTIDFPIQPLVGIVPSEVVELHAPDPEGSANGGVKIVRGEDGDDSTTNNMASLYDALDSQTGLVDARWREDIRAIELNETTPFKGTSDNKLLKKVSVFPEGRPQPSRVSVIYPAHLTFGTWPIRIHLYNTQAHVMQRPVGEHVFPVAETASFRATGLSLNVGYEQRLDYQTAAACSAP